APDGVLAKDRPPAYVTARGSVPKRCAIRLQISSNLMPLRIGFSEGRAMIELPMPAGCEYFVSPESMTRSASSRTACSTSASLYLLPERDRFAEEPSTGTP